jgi:hypothetical protein
MIRMKRLNLSVDQYCYSSTVFFVNYDSDDCRGCLNKIWRATKRELEEEAIEFIS